MIVLEVPGIDAPLMLETVVIPKPYESDCGERFRDFILEGVRKQLEEDDAVAASLFFLMPVPDAPLDVAYASGFIPVNDFMQSNATKRQLLQVAHHLYTKLQTFLSIFISEVWMAESNSEAFSQYGSVKNMPERKEGLVVCWEQRLPSGAVDAHFWLYPVQRVGESGKVLLGEKQEMQNAVGQFVSFLPPLETEARN